MMKKHICLWALILLVGVLFLPILPATASDVTDADFYGIIQTTNNSTAATGVITTITGMNFTALIAGGFVNSTANNCAIQSTTGADMPFMPGYGTNPTVMYNGSVGQNTIVNSLFYTKNVTGGAIRYFPGTTGMSVTDNASLEPGGNFTIEMTNTFLNETGTILNKQNALSLTYDSATQIVTATANLTLVAPTMTNSNGVGTAATVPVSHPAGLAVGDLLIIWIDVYAADGSGIVTITTPAGYTQLFQTPYYSNIKTFGAWYKVIAGGEANPINFTLSENTYYAYRAVRIPTGSYTGVPVAGVSATGAASSPNPPSLTSGFGAVPTLWFANSGSELITTAAPASYSGLLTQLLNSACVSVAHRALTATSEDPGAFTSAATNWAANTIAVQLAGNGTVSVSGISPAEYDFSLVADGTNLTLTVGATSNSTATGGWSIVNNANNWQFGSENTTLYIGDMSVTVGGTLIDLWRYQFAATFTGTVSGIVGTPTFPSAGNDADVSSELILFQPIAEPTAPAFAVGEGPDLISGNITATETPNPVSGNGSLDYPLKEFIDAMGAAGNFPEQWLPTFLSVFVLLALSVTASYFLKESGASSIFVKSCVNIVGYGVLVSLHIFDWWMLIFFFMFEQAIWFAAKERRE